MERLTQFLYLLMLNEVPVGTIPRILENVNLPDSVQITSEAGNDIKFIDQAYANKHLEALAREYTRDILEG